MNEPETRATNTAPRDLLEVPDMMLHRINFQAERCFFVPMAEESYRQSMFLDDRVAVIEDRSGLEVPLESALRFVEQHEALPRRTDFIFHVGHCGSTLISRLLGELPGHLALREPWPMLVLSRAMRAINSGIEPPTDLVTWRRAERLNSVMMSRTFREGQTALVKPSSYCDNLMPDALSANADNRAVFLYMGLEHFLAIMLQTHWRDATYHNVSKYYAHEISQILDEDVDVEALDPGQRAALLWLTYVVRFDLLMSNENLAERCMRVDFDAFLEQPVQQLGEIAGFLGSKVDPVQLETMLRGPIATTYAKQPNVPFGRAQRDEQIRASLRKHGDLVRSGLEWAEARVEGHPLLERAVGWDMQSRRLRLVK